MKTPRKLLTAGLTLLTLSTLNLQRSTAFAQGTTFTYQGRIQSGGTNYTGTGLFKFALVTSTNNSHQATATANLSGPFVTTYNLNYGGNGYVSVPAVHVTGGGGSGATATAVVAGGVVTGITPGSAGSGYGSPPTVTIDPPPANISYTTYWSNDGTSSAGSEPAAAVSAAVANGLFTVAVGDTTLANMSSISTSLFTQPNLQLRIWFNDGANGFAALSPVQNLTATPYASFANTASNLNGTLPAAQVTGTLGLGLLPGTVLTNNGLNVTLTGSFNGNGAGLTNLNAQQMAGGTVADARLSANVALLNGIQVFSGTNRFKFPGTNSGAIYVGANYMGGEPKLIHFGDLQSGSGVGYVYLGENGEDDRLEFRAGKFYFNNGRVGILKTNPATALDVNGTVTAASFSGVGTSLTGVALLNYDQIFTGQNTFQGLVQMQTNIFMNDQDIQLRNDQFHGVGFYGSPKTFAGLNVNGPVVYGYAGGALGSKSSSSTNAALQWNASGNVAIDPTGANTGSLLPGLTFGNGSGEGISSERDSGFNKYGLDFYSQSTARMRIFKDGSVSIGGTNAEHTLDVTGDVGIRGGLGLNTKDGQDPNWPFLPAIIFGDFATSGELITSQRGTSGPNRWGLDLYTRSTSRIAIANNGNVGIGRQPAANRLEVAGDASKDTAGSWLANSDVRIKEDVQSVTGALEKLDQVRLVSFRYTDDYRRTHPGVKDRKYLNVVAQEFREVFPDDVKGSGEKLADGSEILQVDTYPLTIYSAAAVQELNQKLTDELKLRDAQNADLKARLEKLERLVSQQIGGAR